MSKVCFKCNKEKTLNEFYRHAQMADGRLNKCKECTKKDVKERYDRLVQNEEFVKSERKRGRNKYHRLYAGTKTPKNKKAQKNYFMNYPEKYKAKIASSKIPSNGNHNHHWSYNDEHLLDVINLTPKHHAKAHRFIIYDQERRMYRKLSGELLDTREKHLSYIMDKIENEED